MSYRGRVSQDWQESYQITDEAASAVDTIRLVGGDSVGGRACK